MFPQVMVNNQPLNNPPETAGGANQIQAPPLNPQGPNQPPSTASANTGPSANQIQPLPANPGGDTNLPLWCLPVLDRQEAQRTIILSR